jgi:hypothetical protein
MYNMVSAEVVEAVEVEPSSLSESMYCGGMLEWDGTSLLIPAASPLPSTSPTPRIKREQTLHEPSKLEPTIKQKQTQPELEPRIKLETPLKRNRVEDDDLRSPVCSPMHARHHSPNSSVKVCNGPWDRHIRSHRSSHGHCNKCMWANNRWFWCRHTPLDLNPQCATLGCKLGPSTRQTPNGGGLQGLLMGGTPIASCRVVPAPVHDTLRNWTRFAV